MYIILNRYGERSTSCLNNCMCSSLQLLIYPIKSGAAPAPATQLYMYHQLLIMMIWRELYLECDISNAIRSFPKGSAGGPDCLCPQHLLDLTSSTAGPGGVSLLRNLTAFTNLVLSGNTPVIVRPFLFGASLVALKKRDGGLRPIAVGCTFVV